MAGVEGRVREIHKVIVDCIRSPFVAAKLVSLGAISREDGERLRQLYEVDKGNACNEMLQCLYRSQEPGKWTSFLRALQEEEYPHLINLVEGTENLDLSHIHAKTMIGIFQIDLVRNLNPEDLLYELGRKGVLHSDDQEAIIGTLVRNGKPYAMLTLLKLMQTRVSPSKWYYDLLSVLRDTGHEHVVKMLEPEFLINSSNVLPQYGPIQAGSHVIFNNLDEEGHNQSEAEVNICGSHRQHVEKDDVGEVFLNDFLDPPSQACEDKQLNTACDSTTYIKKLNIQKDFNSNLNTTAGEISKSVYTDKEGFDDAASSRSCSTCFSSSQCDCSDSDIDDSFEENSLTSADENDDGEASRPSMKLYNYQLELAENALLGKNTIILAETGTGKTYVAFHIIREHLKKSKDDRRKIVFMARTTVLVKHQCERFNKLLPEYSAKLLSGAEEESRKLHMFMSQPYDILFMTPQILVNNLDDKTIKGLSEFSLLLLDECHHTRGDEPFQRLMRRYLIQKSDGAKRLPQIVGLTATIGVGKSKNEAEAEAHILQVCACLDVELLSTVERYREELHSNTKKPVEETIPLRQPTTDPCKETIVAAMEKTETMLYAKVCMEPDLIDLVHNKRPNDKEAQSYNKWTDDVIKQAESKVKNPSVSREIRSCAMYLNVYNSALEINKLLPSGDVIKYLAAKLKREYDNEQKLTLEEKKLLQILQHAQTHMMTTARNRENPNVRILSTAIRRTIEAKGDESRAMVFVQKRPTCRALSDYLNRDLESMAVYASPLLGHGDRGGDEGMTGKEQEEALHNFENGNVKILVCTSVGNEGISIPNCNIVISYEYAGNEITTIQMKGRARKADATAITLGSERILARESMNGYKAYIMYKATTNVKNMDPKVLQRRVSMLQNEQVRLYAYKMETMKMKERLKTDEDYEILCRRCSSFLCNVSDVKQLHRGYIVVRKDFQTKIEKYPHKHPKSYDGFKKAYKMRCKECPEDLGIITVKDVWECPTLKLQNLKFRKPFTDEVNACKTWDDVPCKIEKIKTEDIPTFFGN